MALLCFQFTTGAQNYSFDNYGLRSDIPSEHVTTIYQSKNGLLFFGFTQGIRAYDSYNFSNVKVEGEKSFHRAVNSFCETKDFYYFNTFTSLYQGKGRYFSKISFKPEKEGHKLTKLFAFRDTVFSLTTNGLYILNNGRFEKVITKTSIDNTHLFKYFLDNQANLWLIRKGGRVSIYNLRSNTDVTNKLLNNDWINKLGISDITEDTHQTYFVAVKQEGIYEIKNKMVKPISTIDGKTLGNRIISLQFEKSTSTLWAASYNEGLIKYSRGQTELITERNGLKYKDIISIFCDLEENIWLATSSHGIVKYKKNGIVNLDANQGLADNTVTGVVQDVKNKQLYILTETGLSVYKNKKLKALTTASEEKIVSISALNNNQFACAYENGTIRLIENGIIQSKKYKLVNADEAISTIVNYKSNLLVGAGYGKLYTYNLTSNTTQSLTVPFKEYVTCFQKSCSEDTVFIGTSSGLYCLTKTSNISPFLLDTLKLDEVGINALIRKDNLLYIATNCYGLFIYDLKKHTTRNYTKSDGLPSNNILNLIVLDTNELVVTSAKYITKVKLKNNSVETAYYRAESDDRYFQFSAQSLAPLMDTKELVLGSDNGILVFSNVLDNSKSFSPKVVINEILINNEVIDWKEHGDSLNKNGLPVNLKLKSKVKNIIIRFNGIKYSTNETITYDYRINESTSGWISLGEGSELFLPELPDGDIKVEIRAAGQDGIWSSPAVLTFDKSPPFWRTRFFGFLALSICLALFAAFFRYNTRFKSDLISNEKSGIFINLHTARLMLVFAAIVIPSANLVYSIVNNEYDEKLLVMICLGLSLLIILALTYISKWIQQNLRTILVTAYLLIICAYISIVILTHVNAFSVISFTLAVTVSTLIIEQIRRYIYFALFIVASVTFVIITIDSPLYNAVLFALAIITSLFVSLISILVKLNVGQRLIFSDTVMNNGNSLVIASNADAQIIFINNTLTKILGFNEEEVLGEGWWNLQKDKDKPVSVKQSILNGTMPKSALSLVKTKNDKHRWIQWENTHMENGVNISIGTDVTEKQEYEKRFSHIVENAKDIIYVTDNLGYFTYVNDIAVLVTGFSKEELLKKNFKDLIREDHRRKVAAFYLMQLKNKGEQSYLEFPIIAKYGKTVWVGQQVMFLEDKTTKEYSGTQAICRDITKRVEAEEKLQIANNDLNMLNQIKEIILRTQDDLDKMLETVVRKLFLNRRGFEQFSLGILTPDNSIRQYSIKNPSEEVQRDIISLSEEDLAAMRQTEQVVFKSNSELPAFVVLDSKPFQSTETVLSLPIKNTESYYGYLNLYSNKIMEYTTEYISILDDVTNYLIACLNQLEQKRVISSKNEEIQQYLSQLEDLNDELTYENQLKEIVIYATDIDDVCTRMLNAIIPASNKAYSYCFNILDIDQKVITSYQGFKDAPFQRHQFEMTETMKTVLFSSGSFLYVYDPDSSVNEELTLFKQPTEGMTCALLAPIKTLTKLHGFLGVYTKSDDLYNATDLRRVESIANIVSSFVSQYYSGLNINLRNEQIQRYSKQLENINVDLEEQNRIKQLIISIKDRDVLIDKLLETIISTSRYALGYSVNLFDEVNNKLCVYYMRRKNTIVFKENISIDIDTLSKFSKLDERIVNHTDSDFETILKLCLSYKQAGVKAKTLMFKSIGIGERILGFIGTYSNIENIYEKTDVKYLIELSSSLQNFLSRDEQTKIIATKNVEIEKYSKRLELLNEARQLLINSTSLKELYRNLIDLMYQRINNVHRISFLIFDSDYENGDLHYLDSLLMDVGYKRIVTKLLPTLPYFIDNKEYDLPDLISKDQLTDDDKHWLKVKIRSVYCVPVFVNGKLFGAINLLSRNINNFSEQKVLINEIKQSVSLIIEQIIYKDIISQKNKDTSDNITYAKRIQTAIMPAKLTLKQLIPTSFLIFEQRDDLGGDFYWFHPLADSILLTIADCTGHGISGSLLTILASNYIQQAVKEKNYTDPALVLEFLNLSVRNTLNQTNSETEILDGLDISCLNYNPKTRFLYYSGAMHNLIIVRNDEIIEFKGNRVSIGSFDVSKANHFTTHLIALQKGDVVFCSTDGYIDQFSHKTGKRFGRIRYKQLILDLAKIPTAQRHQAMITAHNEWKGNGYQTDDICVLSFEVE